MTTITVTNSTELKNALITLSKTGGDIVVANAGESYAIDVSKIGNAGAAIRIVAQDPGNPPDIDQLTLRDSTNISIEGMLFDSSDAGSNSTQFVRIYGGSDITIANSTFVGASDGFYAGEGSATLGGSALMIRGANNVTIADNTISNFAWGIGVTESTGTTISGNDISKITHDGIQMTSVADTLIEGNNLHDFYGSDQNYNHSDLIQVFNVSTNPKVATENLVIRDNILIPGNAASQSIFIQNEAFAKGGAAFQDIVIENNTIYNGSRNGIFVSGADGVSIADNTVLWNSESFILVGGVESVNGAPWILVGNTTGAQVTNNIASGYYIGNAVSSGNITVSQDSASADYVGSNLVNALAAGHVDLRDLVLLEGSAWVGHGSSATQPGTATDGLTAVMRQSASIHDPELVTYDASLSHDGSGGVLDPDTTRYIWTFEDGTTAEGVTVTHAYQDAGDHDVILTVISGTDSDSITRSSKVADDHLIDLDFDTGLVNAGSYTTGITGDTVSALAAGTGGNFHLDGSTKVTLTGAHLNDRQYFTFGLSVKLDKDSASGILARKFGVFDVKIAADGKVSVVVTTTAGAVTVSSAAGEVQDTAWHRIAFAVEGGANGVGELVLYIDGEEVASASIGAALVTNRQNVVIGNPYGTSIAATVDDVTMLASVRDAAWAASDYHKAMGLEPPVDTGGGTAGEDGGQNQGGGSGPVVVPPLTGGGEVTSGDNSEAGASGEEGEADSGGSTPATGGGTTGENQTDGTQTGGEQTGAETLPAGLAQALAAQSGVGAGAVSPLEQVGWLLFDYENGIGRAGRLHGAAAAPQGVSGQGLHLDADNTLHIDRAQMTAGDGFTIGLSLKMDAAGDGGVLIAMQNGMKAVVQDDGAITFTLKTAAGWTTVTTEAGLLSDTDWHRVVFSYDGKSGGAGLEVFVDGTLEGSADATGKVIWTSGSMRGAGDAIGATVDDLAIGTTGSSAADVIADQAAMLSKLAGTGSVSGVYSQNGHIIGTAGADIITGTAGSDLILAREGADTITGGGGADFIILDRAPVAGQADHIIGFDQGGGDRMVLSGDLFDLDRGALDEGALALAGDAIGAGTRLIFDAATGTLSWDADGSGSTEAILIARFEPHTHLDAQAFLVF